MRDIQRIGYTARELEEIQFFAGAGCPSCQRTAYKGRIGVFELLILDDFLRHAIMESKTSPELRQISLESAGLVTLLENGFIKAVDGQTTVSEVLRCLPRLVKPRPLMDIRRLTGG
jgi:type IV pilus assembly protein PilB